MASSTNNHLPVEGECVDLTLDSQDVGECFEIDKMAMEQPDAHECTYHEKKWCFEDLCDLEIAELLYYIEPSVCKAYNLKGLSHHELLCGLFLATGTRGDNFLPSRPYCFTSRLCVS